MKGRAGAEIRDWDWEKRAGVHRGRSLDRVPLSRYWIGWFSDSSIGSEVLLLFPWGGWEAPPAIIVADSSKR